MRPTALLLSISLLVLGTSRLQAAHDWPQWGGSSLRNNVSDDQRHLPAQWKLGGYDPATGRWQAAEAQGVLWVARLGTECYGSPVIAAAKIFSVPTMRRLPAPLPGERPTSAACWPFA